MMNKFEKFSHHQNMKDSSSPSGQVSVSVGVGVERDMSSPSLTASVSPASSVSSPTKDSSQSSYKYHIGSRSNIVTSPHPHHKSVQLAPEAPKQFSPKKMQLADSTTTSPIFRNDVRQEWINAIFGPDFFPNNTGGNALDYTPPRQGMGLANVPSYLSYTATITQPNVLENNSNYSHHHMMGSPSPSKGGINGSNPDETLTRSSKVGVTLSRIPIGVYVRRVDVESEAYVAGVVPGSVLIDINGMGVLGEPSHKLLERLWVYEGHFANVTKEVMLYKVNSLMEESGACSKDEYSSTISNLVGKGRGRGMNGPVSLTLIKDGQVYNVILLTGSPFGISWAPCGNFALVQRSYAHAQKAGVRRGCIVAAVNHRSMRDMDHLDTAMTLKDEFGKCMGVGMASGRSSGKNKDIRIVCVYTPAASRTSYYEKSGSGNGNFSSPSKSHSHGQDFKVLDGVRVRRVSTAKKSKHWSSVGTMEKPTEYGVGSFFTCGTGANYTPVATLQQDHDYISHIANRVAAGEVVAPTGVKQAIGQPSFDQMMADKFSAAQDSPSNAKANEIALVRALLETHNRYGECPGIDCYDVLNKWNFMDALVFCLRMHAASYNEERFTAMGGIMGGSAGESFLLEVRAIPSDRDGNRNMDFNSQGIETAPLHSFHANLNLIKAVAEADYASDIVNTYLLQLMAFISSEQILLSLPKNVDEEMKVAPEEMLQKEVESACGQIIESIVDIAMKDDDLCQRFHFLLRSFSSTYAKSQQNSKNIFSPMQILTSAHYLLRNRLLERDNRERHERSIILSQESSDNGLESNNNDSSSSVQSVSSKMSNTSLEQSMLKSERKSMGKRFGKLFKKSKKPSKLPENDVFEAEHNSSLSPTPQTQGLEFEIPGPSSAQASPKRKKSLGFRPTSILRKAADQMPQDHGYDNMATIAEIPSTANLFENMGWFLSNLDQLCGNIERSLLKSFSQKLTEWALQPWSDNKGRVLAESTADLRKALRELNRIEKNRDNDNKSDRQWSPVLNPMDSSELLLSVVPEESYILPSAHFPLLLSFDACPRQTSVSGQDEEIKLLYRTRVAVVAIRGVDSKSKPLEENMVFVINAAVGGVIKQTGRSTLEPYYGSSTHRWHDNNVLEFESRLPYHPGAIELRVSSLCFDGNIGTGSSVDEGEYFQQQEVGFSFLDISEAWAGNKIHTISHQADVWSYDSQADFDQNGFMSGGPALVPQKLSIEIEVTTEAVSLCQASSRNTESGLHHRRMLLYKHDEDIRQEMLAIQFLGACDDILKASGLDLRLKKYRCIPVGENKGFIEWVPGALSFSELCKPMGQPSGDYSSRNRKVGAKTSTNDSDGSDDCNDNHDEDTSTAFVRTGGWCKYESLRAFRQDPKSVGKHGIGLSGNNPIQDFLRSNAYKSDAPYFIRKEVMDNFVKSCAGYSVVTYLLGVGDRHTDNLLLHPEGHFLHCDYSFILGQDPKTFLPMRITEHMVNAMGGRESDNFAKFVSLAGAAFVALRRPPAVRVLTSLIKGMIHSNIPDVSINQTPEEALKLIYERFCLDLNDDEAVAFLEENIERSLTSKIWVAVDAIHSFGKRF